MLNWGKNEGSRWDIVNMCREAGHKLAKLIGTQGAEGPIHREYNEKETSALLYLKALKNKNKHTHTQTQLCQP